MFDPRWGDVQRDRGDDSRDRHQRDRDDDNAPLGPGSRGPSSRDEKAYSKPRDDQRRPPRDFNARRRDPRDVFMRDLDLPRGREREVVYDARDRTYALRGSETRSLSTVGAFRVVPASSLRDHSGRPADPRSGDLRHLREQGLISTARLDGRCDVAVVLTERGLDLLEYHRSRSAGGPQEFYAGLKRERELEHDSQVFAAYLRVTERLDARGANIDRVVLDYELKRDYQRWLHERDHDRDDYDGHPDREPREIEQWALEHDLPYFNDQVHFPDLRIEYEELDGRRRHEDVEVLTIHYRGAHGAAAARSGFTAYRGFSARIGGRSTGGGRSGGRGDGLAEELLS
jgi:hypothetical protein